MNWRNEIIDRLIPYFKKDKRLFLLVGDMGFAVTDKLKAEYPKRVLNCGIMEQGMVGIAAGMALGGMTPIVYSIVNFLCFRALEQIRNDVVLQKLNVKFIGTGADNYFKHLGVSHCCGKEDITILELIGLNVYDPAKCGGGTIQEQYGVMTIDQWITDESAGYIRV